MEELAGAYVGRSTGVANDSRGVLGHRQVTLLSRAGWDAACAKVGSRLPWTARRANLFTDGIDLRKTTGYTLRVGGAVLVISGETVPCGRMDEACVGLRAALRPNWRGGVTAYVIRPGSIAVGDDVVLNRSIVRRFAVTTYLGVRRCVKRSRRTLGRIARRAGLRRAS